MARSAWALLILLCVPAWAGDVRVISGDRDVTCVAVAGEGPEPRFTPAATPSRCFVDGVDIVAEMIGSGLALNENGPLVPAYAEREAAAREAELGLWGHNCLMQWVVDIREHWAEQAGR